MIVCISEIQLECFIYNLFYDRMNKLNALPRGFGAFPALEVLDLTYNNLSEKSLPGNFFCLGKNCSMLCINHSSYKSTDCRY